MTQNTAELQQGLCAFIGCEQPYRHWANRRFFYTDGVKYFADRAGGGAHWLLDILATQPEIRDLVKAERFCAISLLVSEGSARLKADDGNDGPPSPLTYRREIEFTDCPPGEWKFYIVPTEVGDTNGVMCMLPSEY